MQENPNNQLDVYHWHEALDRASICMEMVDRLLLFHPVIESHSNLKSKAEEAHQFLYSLYQEVASMSLDQLDKVAS